MCELHWTEGKICSRSEHATKRNVRQTKFYCTLMLTEFVKMLTIMFRLYLELLIVARTVPFLFRTSHCASRLVVVCVYVIEYCIMLSSSSGNVYFNQHVSQWNLRQVIIPRYQTLHMHGRITYLILVSSQLRYYTRDFLTYLVFVLLLQ